MKIITFPMRFTEEFHAETKVCAKTQDKSIHQYIIDAIMNANENKPMKEVK